MRQQGASLISSQYKSQWGEIDLIVNLNDTIIFVEVKARKNQNYGGAIYSISKAKQQKIITTANIFLQHYADIYSNVKYNFRFDAIIFEQGKLHWLQNCMSEE